MKLLKGNIVLFYLLLSFALASCDANASCALQAVAGGSQACQETANK
jgi:hypothetical protein